MQKILVFGAGKSATYCIEYLAKKAMEQNFELVVADADVNLLIAKTKHFPHIITKLVSVTNEIDRQALIENCDVCVSLLPPFLHLLVAKDCITYKKHLTTASYADDAIKALDKEAVDNDLLFLCEMGLDPGIDHISAMSLIQKIKNEGNYITSFKSHCGGLVAPESDDNPWQYKITWNPKNIVLSGKAGAVYKEQNNIITKNYTETFEKINDLKTTEGLKLAWYPNRDSLSYIPLYKLENTATFIRTTLRYPKFISGWQKIIAENLTDETPIHVNTDFVTPILEKYKADIQMQFLFANYLNFKPTNSLFSSAEFLQFLLEQNLKLNAKDKDAIIMQHEIEYENANKEKKRIISSLTLIGSDSVYTAMAKTVGIPLAIGAILILNNKCSLRGVQIPIHKELYEPILKELEKEGIVFKEIEEDL